MSIAPYLNQIFCGDCLAVMQTMPDESVDLVVTSPPYNLRNTTGGGLKPGASRKWRQLDHGYSHHDDCMPHSEYVEWQRKCLQEMLRLLKNDGAIFYNHKWRVQGGLMQDRHDIVAGFPVRQVIIWQRAGGINFSDHFFLPTYEVIYLIAKPNFRLVPKSNSVGDVWKIHQDYKNPHPAPFPIVLVERIIGATSAEIVLDPFAGSGTTAVAAKKLGRQYIGIELSPDYCAMAEARLRKAPQGQMVRSFADRFV